MSNSQRISLVRKSHRNNFTGTLNLMSVYMNTSRAAPINAYRALIPLLATHFSPHYLMTSLKLGNLIFSSFPSSPNFYSSSFGFDSLISSSSWLVSFKSPTTVFLIATSLCSNACRMSRGNGTSFSSNLARSKP